MEPSERFFSPERVRQKLEKWCAYQDRSTHEVRERLRKFNLTEVENSEILQHLKDLNFLDEERFVTSFVSGKFRIKKWGRIKIRQQLALKRIDKRMIEQELQKIDDELYFDCIISLLEKKNKLTTEKDIWKKKAKLIRYVASRGFELEFIQDCLKRIKVD